MLLLLQPALLGLGLALAATLITSSAHLRRVGHGWLGRVRFRDSRSVSRFVRGSSTRTHRPISVGHSDRVESGIKG
jgi:hypothetical protein